MQSNKQKAFFRFVLRVFCTECQSHINIDINELSEEVELSPKNYIYIHIYLPKGRRRGNSKESVV